PESICSRPRSFLAILSMELSQVPGKSGSERPLAFTSAMIGQSPFSQRINPFSLTNHFSFNSLSSLRNSSIVIFLPPIDFLFDSRPKVVQRSHLRWVAIGPVRMKIKRSFAICSFSCVVRQQSEELYYYITERSLLTSR